IRSEDTLARYGGEEFVILVRGTPEVGVKVIAERVRSGVEALKIDFEGQPIPMTVSVGIASVGQSRCPIQSASELLAIADAALYRAKEAGRNQVHGL
ncbi:MAG: GGDEF domain-containing protein, partial [Polyangiaceae bacterium]|nr:GGDEF domain-containing protein [Polyangiaceae bacterium]